LMQQYVRTFPWNIKVNKFVAPAQPEQLPQEELPPEQWLPWQVPTQQPTDWWRLPWESDAQLAQRLQQTS
jgi:hypothetical protein